MLTLLDLLIVLKLSPLNWSFPIWLWAVAILGEVTVGLRYSRWEKIWRDK